MFERFDESARRALFFARYAATELRARAIESEHLLLGLIREKGGLAARVLIALPVSDLRKELESARTAEPPLDVSVEIPFSVGTKRALMHAAEEADRLSHRHIGTEHLLLGLMLEGDSLAAVALARHGMRLDDARRRMQQLSSVPPSTRAASPEVLAQIQQIGESAAHLVTLLSDNPEASMRVELLLLDLEALKSLIHDQP